MSSTPVAAGRGLVKLSGNLYRVPVELIVYAEDGDLVGFVNPRKVMVGGKPQANGFSPEEMNELREAIRMEGLQHPLLLHKRDKESHKELLAIINGERRKRCIDRLIKENTPCFDPTTNKFVPARELYDYVECRVYFNLTPKAAYKYAFSSNERAVGIGEGATVALIRQWKKDGWPEEDLQEVTGKSITWFRDTLRLTRLDERSFAALCNNEINRTVALCLSKIDNEEERLKRLMRARDFAAQRIRTLQEKCDMDLHDAEAAAEVAESQVAYADHLGNETMKKEVVEKHKRAGDRVITLKGKQEELQSKTVKVTGKDLDKAAGEVEDIVKRLTFAKIEKCWVGDLHRLKQGGEAVCSKNGVRLEDVELALALWYEGIERNMKDVIPILQENKRHVEKKRGAR